MVNVINIGRGSNMSCGWRCFNILFVLCADLCDTEIMFNAYATSNGNMICECTIASSIYPFSLLRIY
jgi:hypothetical protein